jgi:DNA-binding GntR family transcriptional regulator
MRRANHLGNNALPPVQDTIALLRSRSLSTALQDEIERRILAGIYKAGDRINENALAQALGISRGPIREACRGLVESRLLTVIVNRGFFVRAISAREAAEVYDVRAALMRVAGDTLARRITDGQIETLRTLVRRMDEAAGRDDIDAYYALNVEFHDRIVNDSENDRLRAMCEGLAKELRLYRRRSLTSAGGMRASNREHETIVAAFAARDPAAAAATLERHMLAAKKRFIEAAETADTATAAAPPHHGKEKK